MASDARTCAVCGAPCPPPFRAPAAELAPDLDGRPGEPARSTLKRWIATCRACGASAPDLAAVPPSASATVRSDPYRALRSPFLRWAALCAASGDTAAEAEALLQAAWDAEDTDADGGPLRRRAAAIWQGDPLRRVDILRRAGAFAEAAAAAGSVEPRDADAARILAFQQDRIAARDSGRQMLSSALRPPARNPHAAHGKGRATGWWARLFGG